MSIDQRQLESAKWLACLERGIRGDEGPRLKAWLSDPRNRDAIIEAGGLWHSRDVQSLLFAVTGMSPQQRSTTAKPSLVLPLLVALASTAGLFMLIFGHRSAHDPGRAPAVAGILYDTAIGETRQVTLLDGTRVMLNTNTRLSVSFLTHAREVTLIRGEATFDVAHEAARPFNVLAGQRTFQALGTQFNVRVLPDGNVDLIVTRGQVKVLDVRPRLPDTPERRRETLLWGELTVDPLQEAIVYPGFQTLSPIDADDVQARLAWQKGMIVFDDKALSDALVEIQRYTPTKFVLSDAKLGDLRVRGSFRTGNVNAVRLALRRNFFIASRRDTRGRIVLSAVHAS